MKWLLFLLIIISAFSRLNVEAAGWAPNGHPEITFDAATQGEIHLPEDISKVIAIGSVAPDFFEFDNPIAHAQTPDPSLTENGEIAVSTIDFELQHEDAYTSSEKWFEFYFSSAVLAMKAGQRERAAFLLGYALHNREDFATHRGMTNLMHSVLDQGGGSPDSSPNRLALAHEMASLELLRFKETVGPQNWRLFSGETVRNNNSVGSIIPEPLTLAIGLKDWNPRSGIIPSSTSAVAIVQSKIGNQYTTDIRGEIEEGKRQQVENYLGGLLQRQEAMLAYLEIARGPDDPKLPLRKSIEGLLKDASDGADFACTLSLFRENCLPRKYQRLSLADRKLLGLLRWEKLHKEKLRNLRELRQKSRKDMIKMYSTQVAKMRARADRHEQHRKALMLGRDKFLGD